VDVIRARLDVERHRTPAQRWLLGEDYRDRPAEPSGVDVIAERSARERDDSQ
jgi:hypothetical protein